MSEGGGSERPSAKELLAKRGGAASILARSRARAGGDVAAAGAAPAGAAGSAASGASARLAGRSTLAGLTKSAALSKFQSAATRSLAVDAFAGGFGAVGGEKAAIVLDIGTAYTKCGFSNEPTPRHIIRSVTTLHGREVPVYDPEEMRSTAVLTEVLIRFLHDIFYQRLLVKTTDRRVVLVEPLASPARFRSALVDLLYRHYLVLSVMQLPAATVATVPLWLNTALVVDCGHSETTVTAVFDGVPAVRSFRAVPAAATEVHAQVRQRLAGAWDGVPDEALEDIKVRACVAGKLPEGVELPALRYPAKGAPGGSVTLSPELRAHACDSLFDGVADGDASCVPSAILDALLAAPVDARKALARSVVLCGGTAMLPGFKHRLAGAIAALAKEPEYRSLVGTLSRRCVVTVTLKAAEAGRLNVGDLRGNAHRVLDDLLDRLRTGGAQVSDASVTVAEDKKVVCVFRSPDDDVDETLIRKDKSSLLVGRRTYAILDVAKATEESASGVTDAIAFAETPVPPNILAWVGASVLGTLETLASKSLSREGYLSKPISGPDYTANCSEPPSAPPVEPKPALPDKWKVKIGRPMAWGCGSLAVPPEVQQHAV